MCSHIVLVCKLIRQGPQKNTSGGQFLRTGCQDREYCFAEVFFLFFSYFCFADISLFFGGNFFLLFVSKNQWDFFCWYFYKFWVKNVCELFRESIELNHHHRQDDASLHHAGIGKIWFFLPSRWRLITSCRNRKNLIFSTCLTFKLNIRHLHYPQTMYIVAHTACT